MRPRTALAILVATGAACAEHATSPSSGFTLACPLAMRVEAPASGAVVTYPSPTASGGQPPVAVACTPPSGSTFPVGTTTVDCTATDARGQTAACQTVVNVVLVPTLQRTRFLAFGDSITAGEVTVPASPTSEGPPILTQVVVPDASYPSQLLPQLQARYPSQVPQIAMVNEGKPAEPILLGLPRLGQILANGSHEVLLILHGYNDLLGDRAAAIPRVSGALDLIAREGRLRGLRVYLATFTPSIPGRQRSIPDAVLRQMNEEVRIIAAGEGAVLVDLYPALLPDLNRYIGVDGLHPTEAGYKRMADEFYARIRDTLEVR